MQEGLNTPSGHALLEEPPPVERHGDWMSDPSLVTPAGIRQAYPLFERPAHLRWNRDEFSGLTYLDTNTGPMRS